MGLPQSAHLITQIDHYESLKSYYLDAILGETSGTLIVRVVQGRSSKYSFASTFDLRVLFWKYASRNPTAPASPGSMFKPMKKMMPRTMPVLNTVIHRSFVYPL